MKTQNHQTTTPRHLAVLLSLLALATAAQADTVTYTGGAGDHNWTDAIWSATPSGATNDVTLNGIGANVTSSADVATMRSFRLYDGAILRLTGGTFNVASSNLTYVGNNANTARLYIDNGATLSTGRIRIADISGASGEVNVLSGGILNLTGTDSYVGCATSSTGTLNISGTVDTIATTRIFIGTGANSTGTVTINSGGVLNYNHTSNSLDFGYGANSNATLNINGGTLNHTSTALCLGNNSQSANINVTLDGGAINAKGLSVGWAAGTSANLTLNDGTLTSTDAVTIAYNENASANLAIHGGSFVTNSTVYFGRGNSTIADITQTGGTFRINGAVSIFFANGADSNVTYTLSGNGKLISDHQLQMARGARSNATFNQSGGNVSVTQLYLGAYNAASASDAASANLNISGGVFEVTSTDETLLFVAYGVNSTAALNLSGSGKLLSNTDLVVGYSANSTGSLTIANSALLKTRNAWLGSTRTHATANLSGGSLDASGFVRVASTDATADVSLSGNARLLAGTDLILGYGSRSVATVSANGSASLSAADVFLAYGTTGSSASLNLSDAASLSASGNLVIGGVTQNGGEALNSTARLSANDTASVSAGGALVIGNGTHVLSARLELSGSAKASAASLRLGRGSLLLNGGNLSASGEILVSSTSIASLSLNGGSLSADSLRFDVTGAAFAGSLDISGSISALSLTNGIIIDLSNWSGDATLLAPITLLTYNDAATEHLSVSLNYGANAGLLNVSHTWNAGALSLMVAPVPEPATTAALLALLTLTLLLRRRQT